MVPADRKISMPRKISEVVQLRKPSVELSQEPSSPAVNLTNTQLATEKRLRSDVMESPNSKNKYKLISRDMKEMEKTSNFEKLLQASLMKIVTLNVPHKIHWRVYLDLADFAKRESKFEEARQFFKIVIST